jgi:hypothetical protein
MTVTPKITTTVSASEKTSTPSEISAAIPEITTTTLDLTEIPEKSTINEESLPTIQKTITTASNIIKITKKVSTTAAAESNNLAPIHGAKTSVSVVTVSDYDYPSIDFETTTRGDHDNSAPASDSTSSFADTNGQVSYSRVPLFDVKTSVNGYPAPVTGTTTPDYDYPELVSNSINPEYD